MSQINPNVRQYRSGLLLVALIIAVFLLNGAYDNAYEGSEEVLARLPEKVDFNFHIKPILSDRCFACHGPDENARQGNLRLDIPEAAFADMDSSFWSSHYAIRPGNLQKSEVYQRLYTDDPEKVMPPPDAQLQLTEREKALISRWIKQGAEWKSHWAFIPPEAVEPPSLAGDWGHNSIDQWIQAKWSEKDFQAKPEASREVLIRRLAFDFTGLPPTIEEIDAFLNDTSPNAYARLVDHYLDSPHYGERMATDWLDLARFADSHGYQDDGIRPMWPWRDWVIQAFNDNMPYDQFLSWQIAGDLYPNATKEQILATGFGRLHMQSQEGGIIEEEFRVEYVADRVKTVGTAFMGLTMECARCHDHKYDPITQEEYYQLFGFFNNINERGQIGYRSHPGPGLVLSNEKVDSIRQYLAGEMEQTKASLDQLSQKEKLNFEAWWETIRKKKTPFTSPQKGLLAHFPLDHLPTDFTYFSTHDPKIKTALEGEGRDSLKLVEEDIGPVIRLDDQSYFNMGRDFAVFDRYQAFAFDVKFSTPGSTKTLAVFSHAGDIFNNCKGYEVLLIDNHLHLRLSGSYPANTIDLKSRDTLAVNQWHQLSFTYDGSSEASGFLIYLNGKPLEMEVIWDDLYKTTVLTEANSWNRYRPNFLIGLCREFDFGGGAVRDLRVYERQLTELELMQLQGLDTVVNAWRRLPADQLSSATQSILLEYYLHTQSDEYEQKKQALQAQRKQDHELTDSLMEVMVMAERKVPRATFILDRGAYDAPTKAVKAAAPKVILPFADTLPPNRLGLAEWLCDPNNPLTARVFVNRIWQQFFGQGIVSSPEDFGNQGHLPSHPELLDWLSYQFVHNGWDIKALQKQIVLSATYRQSSKASKADLEIDLFNEYYARGPAFRLSAEMMRDNALAASSLLVPRIGGPSVKPYQPPGLWKELATRNDTEYVQGSGADLYRRSLYTFWKRTTPPPSMITMDAAERNYCAVRRQRTSTPLQALVLLNDPQYLEAARVLAEDLMTSETRNSHQNIQEAYRRLCTSSPNSGTVDMLVELFEQEQASYQAKPSAAKALLAIGERPYNTNLAIPTLAAYTVVVNAIMNTDASVMRR